MASPDTKSRWLELAISVVASIVASSIAATWTISTRLAEIDTVQRQVVERVQSNEHTQRAMQAELSSHTTQIAVAGTQWAEVIRRLESIEQKLERR